MTKKTPTFLIVAIALLIVSAIVFLISQYLDKQEKLNSASSNSSLFQMNYANNLSNAIPYYLFGDNINIKLFNTVDLKINASDIAYSVKVENSVGTDITSSLIITGNDGVLKGGILSTDNIDILGVKMDTLYVVKISSTTPYIKTLCAKFMFRSIDNTYYTLTDYGNYITLDLFVGSVAPNSDLTINYGANLAPDNTNNLMTSWFNATNGTILHSSLVCKRVYSFTFFEQNITANYTTASTILDLTTAQTITITAN